MGSSIGGVQQNLFGANFPLHLSKHTQQQFRIRTAEFQPPHQATNLCGRRVRSVLSQITAFAECLYQELSQSLDFPSGGGLASRNGTTVLRGSTRTDTPPRSPDSCRMRFPRRNVHQPMTVAQIVIRQSNLLRPKQQSNASRCKRLANTPATLLQRIKRLMGLSIAQRRRAYHEWTIAHGVRERRELLCTLHHSRSPDRRARFAKGHIVRIHHPQIKKSSCSSREQLRACSADYAWPREPRAVGRVQYL